MRKQYISTRIAKVKCCSQSVASHTPLVGFWKRSFIFLLLQWQNTIYTWWLKITHIYYLIVLNARSLKLLARLCYFLEDLGENPFHFLGWENSVPCSLWLSSPFHCGSELRAILSFMKLLIFLALWPLCPLTNPTRIVQIFLTLVISPASPSIVTSLTSSLPSSSTFKNSHDSIRTTW